MTELYIVISDLFIGQSFVCFGQLNKVLVQGFEGDVLLGIWPDFIGMKFEGQFSVM